MISSALAFVGPLGAPVVPPDSDFLFPKEVGHQSDSGFGLWRMSCSTGCSSRGHPADCMETLLFQLDGAGVHVQCVEITSQYMHTMAEKKGYR